MEEMKKARVFYQEDNGRGKEGYVVEIFIEDDWGLDSFYPLTFREGAGDEEEKNFVHFSIINKLKQLTDLGYTIIYK